MSACLSMVTSRELGGSGLESDEQVAYLVATFRGGNDRNAVWFYVHPVDHLSCISPYRPLCAYASRQQKLGEFLHASSTGLSTSAKSSAEGPMSIEDLTGIPTTGQDQPGFKKPVASSPMCRRP